MHAVRFKHSVRVTHCARPGSGRIHPRGDSESVGGRRGAHRSASAGAEDCRAGRRLHSLCFDDIELLRAPCARSVSARVHSGSPHDTTRHDTTHTTHYIHHKAHPSFPRIAEIAQVCKASGIGHIINNAYGVQTSKSMHLIIEVCLSTRTRHTTHDTRRTRRAHARTSFVRFVC
jgi:hypothetical protein